MAPGDTARLYHRLSSFGPSRVDVQPPVDHPLVRQDFERFDLAIFHLAAYALGIGASGMTFLDSEIAGLLGEPLAGLLVTCVGVQTYRTTLGGRPGEPVAIVSPVAGETIARPPATRGG